MPHFQQQIPYPLSYPQNSQNQQDGTPTQSKINLFGQVQENLENDMDYTKLAKLNGDPLIIGVDEVGRGCLLGSVVIAGMILPPQFSVALPNPKILDSRLAGLNDSKKLSEKKRNALFPLIQQNAWAWCLVEIPARIIDEINILKATLLGMTIALETLETQLKQNLAQCPRLQPLIDGNQAPEYTHPPSQLQDPKTLIQGDTHHASIAAASILAKVHRDNLMYQMATQHPHHAIDKHKGYPTKAHKHAILKYGLLPEHRRTFKPIKNLIKPN